MYLKKYEFKGTPAPYQIEAVAKALKRKAFGVFFEQRVGKTRVGIDFAGTLYVEKHLNRCVVVCPVSAIGAWETQIPEYLPDDIPYVVQKFDPKHDLSTSKSLVFLLVTYDLARIHLAKIMDWNPHCVIADEVHKLKKHTSARSKALGKIALNAPYRLGLTGTPVAHKPVDIFGIFHFIDQTIFGKAINKFKNQYCIMGGYMQYEVVGYQEGALEEIARKVASASIRVLRKDVMIEPQEEHHTVLTDFETKGKVYYGLMRKESLAMLTSGSSVTGDTPLVRLLRLHQIAGGFLTDKNTGEVEVVSVSKINLAKQLIEDILEDEEEKVVVFCRFTPELEALERMCINIGVRPMVISGAVDQKERERRLDAFRNHPAVKVIILQQSAGNSGFSLAPASNVIFYSMTFSVLEYQQAKDRVMGREQTSPVVRYYYLAVRNTVDLKIMTDIRKGIDIASQISDRFRYYLE